MTEYTPEPIDTTKVTISLELSQLVETLAGNAHEVWASQRIREGWTWGPERSDVKLEHPCLIPYEQLPESEKQYDRLLVEQAIKSIVALGYQIVKI